MVMDVFCDGGIASSSHNILIYTARDKGNFLSNKPMGISFRLLLGIFFSFFFFLFFNHAAKPSELQLDF